ncbi:MAG: GLPGLI family protein [Chitinophagaceae bacterium]|nr:GLPGLI family protein [Chitinophagaceae bacterium]
MQRVKLLITIVSLLLAIAGFSQETVSLNVVYEFRYARDIAAKDSLYTANMVLSLGRNTSRYCTEKLYLENDKNAIKRRLAQQLRQNNAAKPAEVVSGGPLLLVNKYGAIINEEILLNRADSSLQLYSVLGFKTYRVESVIPKIDWKTAEDKKMIGIYACQKATGFYAGRTYEAWFAPELPYQLGPWKLTGLPGLILEARDQKNEVFFSFKSLVKNTDAEEITRSFLNTGDYIKTTLKAYNKAKKAFETDPESVMAAMAPNATVAVINTDDANAAHARKIKKYNPLELD